MRIERTGQREIQSAVERAVKRWSLAAALLGAGLFGALLPAGCGGDGDDGETKPCPIGDLTAPAEIQIVHLDAQDRVIETKSMDAVPLIAPPQGGWIVLLGVRAKNIDGCRITLTTALVDSCDNQVIQIDRRPTKLEVGPDGWGVSTVTTFGNLPVCPQLTATRDLHSVPYVVQVAIEDAEGQSASASMTVVPTCLAGSDRCPCECDRDYTVGTDCALIGTGAPHNTCTKADEL